MKSKILFLSLSILLSLNINAETYITGLSKSVVKSQNIVVADALGNNNPVEEVLDPEQLDFNFVQVRSNGSFIDNNSSTSYLYAIDNDPLTKTESIRIENSGTWTAFEYEFKESYYGSLSLIWEHAVEGGSGQARFDVYCKNPSNTVAYLWYDTDKYSSSDFTSETLTRTVNNCKLLTISFMNVGTGIPSIKISEIVKNN